MRRLWLSIGAACVLGLAAACGNSGDAATPATSAESAAEPPGLPAPPDVAAAPANAQKTASGIAWIELKAGTGTIHPTPTSTVKVNYAGWTTDGKNFDASSRHGGPTEFRLNGVVQGWTEGIQLMVIGEKRRFWIPGALAYDDDPRPGVPKGLLVFDIELLDIK